MFDPRKTVLLVMDMQGNLALRMHESEQLFIHIKALIKMARILNIPILWTEQAPEKIGATVEDIAKELTGINVMKKQTFSCYAAGDFQEELEKLKRKQIIVCGIETHVCIFQTAMDLLAAHYQLQIVTDAVSSRKLSDKTTALNRLFSEGAALTSTEMIATELIRGADHPQFKEILGLIR